MKFRFVWAMAVVGLVGCGDDQATRQVTETRIVQSARDQSGVASSTERFGAAPPTTPDVHEAHATPFEWDQPAGWVLAGPRPMREVTFQVGDSQDAECYVAILRGDGGGLQANLDRWRGQMDRPPLSADEVAALPRITVLGIPSAMIEVEGTFKGMSGESKEDCALAGVVCLLEDRSVFVKMIGPPDVVRGERDRFGAFCQSLRVP